MTEMLSQRGYARHAGVSHPTVRAWIDKGLIELGPGGKIDRDAADRRRAKAEPDVDDLPVRRDLKDKIDAERLRKLKLENDLAEGALRPSAEVRAEAFRVGRQVRDIILGMPSVAAPVIATATGADVSAVHAILEDQVRNHLQRCTDLGGQ